MYESVHRSWRNYVYETKVQTRRTRFGLSDEKQLPVLGEFVRYRYRYQIVFIMNLSQWRFNERDGVSNHQCLDGLLKHLFRRRSKKTSLAFVRGIHRWSVNSPHKGPVTRKMFPFDDVIMANDYFQNTQTGWPSPPGVETEHHCQRPGRTGSFSMPLALRLQWSDQS